ncbi:NEAT domain-containing protein [Inediibacterium massiliense]|uniref:NEAT domain-containing protein n=1 Tax=Inediibacterium massiliense TaxID=1658111 RepID=UPI0006B55FB4|nr:NEAT domain-containing protein [Inediibacterium massiliense]
MNIFKDIHRRISILLIMVLIIGGIPQASIAISDEESVSIQEVSSVDKEEKSQDKTDHEVSDESDEDVQTIENNKEKQDIEDIDKKSDDGIEVTAENDNDDVKEENEIKSDQDIEEVIDDTQEKQDTIHIEKESEETETESKEKNDKEIKEDSKIEIDAETLKSEDQKQEQEDQESLDKNQVKIENKMEEKQEEENLEPKPEPEKPIIELNKNGTYEVEVKGLQEKEDKESIAGAYLGEKAKIQVKDSKKYMILLLKRSDWMSNIKISVGGQEVKHEAKVINKNEEEETESSIKFEIPNLESEIQFSMNVEPMGNMPAIFRVVPNKDTLKFMKEDIDEEKPEPKPEKPSIELDKNGTYEVEVKGLQEKEDKESIAGAYLGEKAKIQVKDSKKYMILLLKRSDWMSNIKISVGGQEVKHEAKVINQNEEGETESSIKFEIPNLESEIQFSMNVEPMGNMPAIFRVVPNKDTLKFMKEDIDEEKPEPKPEEPNVDISKNGTYEGNVKVLQKENNELSDTLDWLLADQGKLQIIDGKKYVEIAIFKSEGIKIGKIAVDGKEVKYTQRTGKIKTDDYLFIKYEVPSIDSEMIMTIPIHYEPWNLEGRIVFDKNTLHLIEESKDEEKPEPKPEKPSIELDKNGTYEVEVKGLQEKEDKESIAGAYLGEKAKIEVKDSKKYMILLLKRSDWMSNIKISVGGQEVKHEETIVNKNEEGETESSIKFEIPNLESEIQFSMNVEPMGNMPAIFRVVPNKDTLKFIKEDIEEEKPEPEKPDTKPEKPSTELNKNGIYEVEVKGLKEDVDEESRAGKYLGEKAEIQVKDAKKYMIVQLNQRNIMNNIQVSVDGKVVKHEEKINESKETESNVKFEIPSLDVEIKINMNVTLMGNRRTGFRIVPTKDTLKFIKEDIEEEKPEKPEKPSVELDKNGTYEVEVKGLQEKEDKESIAGAYVGEKAKIQVKDAKKYMTLLLKSSNWMSNIRISVGGQEVKHEAKVINKNEEGETESSIKFEIPNLESEIKFSMNVKPMGNMPAIFRVVPNKDTLKFIKEDTEEEKPEPKPEKPNTDQPKDNEQVIEISLEKPMELQVTDQSKRIVIPKLTDEIIQKGQLNINVEDIKNATIQVPVSGNEKKEVKLPKIAIDSNIAQVEIPKGITITSENGKWDGTIKMPTLIENENISNIQLERVVEVGFEDGNLNFDQPIRLVMKGQAGKKAGYLKDGQLKEITNILSQDTQQAANHMLSKDANRQEAKIDVGKDLVIWTKHFTKFVAYKELDSSNNPGNNGGSNGNGGKNDSINENEDGIYGVKIKTLKENDDSESMAITYLSDEAIYEVKNGKKYIKFVLIHSDWMKDKEVFVDGKKVNYTLTTIKEYDEKNQEGKNKIDSMIKFEIPSLDSKIVCKMTIMPIGDIRVAFRLVPQKNTLIKKDSDDISYNSRKGQTNINIEMDKNGIYGVDLKLVNEKGEEVSDLKEYIGQKANIKVEDSKKYMKMLLKKSGQMKNIEITVDGNKVEHKIEDIKKYEDGKIVSTIQFKIKDLDSKIKLQMDLEGKENKKVVLEVLPQKESVIIKEKDDFQDDMNEFSKINLEEDGIYEAEVEILKEINDHSEMVKPYLKDNIRLRVEDKKTYMTVFFEKSEEIKDLTAFVDWSSVKHEWKDTDHSEVEFEIPNIDSKYRFHMNIDSIKNKRLEFSIIPKKETFKVKDQKNKGESHDEK